MAQRRRHLPSTTDELAAALVHVDRVIAGFENAHEEFKGDVSFGDGMLRGLERLISNFEQHSARIGKDSFSGITVPEDTLRLIDAQHFTTDPKLGPPIDLVRRRLQKRLDEVINKRSEMTVKLGRVRAFHELLVDRLPELGEDYAEMGRTVRETMTALEEEAHAGFNPTE